MVLIPTLFRKFPCYHTYDLVPLIDVIGTGEQHPATDHLSHDATDGPYIDVLLVAHTKDDLRGAVVPRHDVRRHHEGRPGRAGQSKVQNLQRAVRFDYDVGRFQVLQANEKFFILLLNSK